MSDKSEERLLQLVADYINGNFTIQSEKPLIEEVISLISPTLSANDVFNVLFGGNVETPEEGVAALLSFAQTQKKWLLAVLQYYVDIKIVLFLPVSWVYPVLRFNKCYI